MADSPPPPPSPSPSPPQPPPNPTTIAALSDDLLREIFLRLPDDTSLARAAFACRGFLRAVRSSPAFRRRFRQLHAPPLLALFLMPEMGAVVLAEAGKSSDIAASFQHLLQDSDASKSKWRSDTESPYIPIGHLAIDQGAYHYNPYTRAVDIYPRDRNNALLQFYTLYPDGEEQRPSRVVCVYRDRVWAWVRVAVFSSQTMEWQVVLPEMDIGVPPVDYHRCARGTIVNGFVCWVHHVEGYILMLNTATFQFSQIELPRPWQAANTMFELGHTKDGKFCVVNVHVLQCVLSVWFWAADDDGVERFMLHKTFSLRANVNEITKCSEEAHITMQPMAVINGFVYLSLIVDNNGVGDPHSPEWLLSFDLETTEVNLLHKETHRFCCFVYPYIMVSWPSSLIHGKEELEAEVTGNIYESGGPMVIEEASPVLFTALQSFKEKLIDDGNSNFAEVDSFLLDDERNSLLKRITTLESGLAAARKGVLRIHTKPYGMNGMDLVTSESGLPAARDHVLRSGTESDSMEGMERVSWWQMCKVMLGRACSRFFTR